MPEPSTIVAALLIAVVPSVALPARPQRDRPVREGALDDPPGLPRPGSGGRADPASMLVLVLLGRPAALPPAFAPGLRPDPVVGIVEEVVKGLLLLGLVRSVRDEFDDVLDGVIYGAALGAGFGAAESFLYVLGGTGQLGGDTVGAAGGGRPQQRLLHGGLRGDPRLRPAPAPRPAGASSSGWASPPRRSCTPSTTPCLPILARLLGQPDAALGLASRLLAEAINWLGILTLVLIVVMAWRREARILRAELRDEVASGPRERGGLRHDHLVRRAPAAASSGSSAPAACGRCCSSVACTPPRASWPSTSGG